MQPGLTRAVPMAVLGFIGGAVFVIVLRALQSLDPVLDPGIVLIMCAFTTSGAFVWGMGAGDPAMSAHPHEPEVDAETGIVLVDAEEDHHEDEELDAPPTRTLVATMWQVSFALIILLVAVLGFAMLPTGFTMKISSDPGAERTAVSTQMIELPLLGNEFAATQGTIFVLVIIVTLVIIAVIGGGLALMLTSLDAGVKSVAEVESTALPTNTKTEALASGDEAEAVPLGDRPGLFDYVLFGGLTLVLYWLLDTLLIGEPVPDPAWLRVGLSAFFAIIFAAYFTIRPVLHNTIGENATNFLIFVGAAGGLYTAFYYVLIGLPIARPGWLRWSLSVINAIGLAFTIVYPGVLVRSIGRGAASAAKSLRGLPEGLGQK